MKEYRILASICIIITLSFGCLPKKNTKDDVSKIKILNGDMAFSVEELTSEPGDKVSFNLFNGLKKEKLKFYLLRSDEDPIVVQHLKAQQGEVPEEYFIFESKDIEPNTSLDISFDAPKEEGVYAYVGVSDLPRETMVGKLVVEKREPVEKELN